MKFYTQPHDFYCGIDLHARSMYLCILDRDGKIVLHHNMASAPEPFLQAIAPYRENLVVGVECIFCWYWLADRAKNDKIDAYKIASLSGGGIWVAAGALNASPIRLCRRASRWIWH